MGGAQVLPGELSLDTNQRVAFGWKCILFVEIWPAYAILPTYFDGTQCRFHCSRLL